MHTSIRHHLGLRRLLALLVTLALLPLLALPARAAGFTVTTLADSGPGSLREAIDLANRTEGADTITFTLSGTIVLASTLPAIDGELTIDGTGQSITISGNNAVRVIAINRGKTLDLNALTIANGLCSDCHGGGLYNDGGTVNVNHSTFSGNSAACSPSCGTNGGAIANWEGVLNVSNSSFSANSASGHGSGIYNKGTLAVSNSSFAGNSASSEGGGISNYSTLMVSNSSFAGNSAVYGGGIYNYGTLAVSNSSFSANSAIYGGGIYNNPGTLTVSNSTFSANSAGELGGGIQNHGTLTVSNSTFSANSAGMLGGGITNFGESTTLKNTIVANSTAGGDCAGAISADSHTLASDGSCGGATQKSSAELNLGPLSDNGGPTQTIALLVGSAAIDAGDDAVCAADPVNNLDQRGISRPQGSHCDIGAYEAKPAFPAISVLDDFNRPDGKLGTNWQSLTSTSFYKIASNKLDVQLGGPLVWKSAFGTSQEAFVTLSTLDAKSPSTGLLLKVQDSSRTEAGAILVEYDARAKKLRVSAIRLGKSWTLYLNQTATFATGGVLGARAKADGTVQIYKNGTLLTTVTLNAADQAFFNAKGGKIGIWTAAAPNAILDDFGGGTLP